MEYVPYALQLQSPAARAHMIMISISPISGRLQLGTSIDVAGGRLMMCMIVSEGNGGNVRHNPKYAHLNNFGPGRARGIQDGAAGCTAGSNRRRRSIFLDDLKRN